MRVAVFTNEFPGLVSTFFSRDMQGLLVAGLDIDVFPVRPLDATLWQYVPETLTQRLPRSKVHHVGFNHAAALLKPSFDRIPAFAKDAASIGLSAVRFGPRPAAKTSYVFLKAWVAAQRRERYDHVVSYWGSYAGTYAYLFHRLTNPTVPFSMFLHAGDLYDDQVYLDKKLLYSDNVFVVCDFNRQFIKKLYPDIFDIISPKIHIYHPSLDLSEFPYRPVQMRSSRVLAVGRFDRCKGYDYLLRAIALLAREGSDVKLDLIGDGAEAGGLQKLASELAIQDKVTFHGWRPFADVKAAMAGAGLFVHPSSEVGDAVPTVIKESMALGMTVVATNVAGIPELLDHGRCGVLVPPRDIAALANAIKTMLASPEQRQAYAAEGRKFAEEHFDLSRNSKRLAAALRSSRRGHHA